MRDFYEVTVCDICGKEIIEKAGNSHSEITNQTFGKLRIPGFPEFDICKNCAVATYSFLSLRHDEQVGGPLMKAKMEQDGEVMKKLYTIFNERNNRKRIGGIAT